MTTSMPYWVALQYAELPSLSDRRDKLCRDFFCKLLNPSNCINHLLPSPRGTEITSRFRKATTYPRPRTPNRTNCYNSFIHHALLKYCFFFIALHCISFLVLYCFVVQCSIVCLAVLFLPFWLTSSIELNLNLNLSASNKQFDGCALTLRWRTLLLKLQLVLCSRLYKEYEICTW